MLSIPARGMVACVFVPTFCIEEVSELRGRDLDAGRADAAAQLGDLERLEHEHAHVQVALRTDVRAEGARNQRGQRC